MAQVWQVQVAVPDEDVAIRLAQSAVEARLAAGGQVVGPVVSCYWHHGKFDTGQEWQVVLKTTAACYQDLEDHIVKHHPWDNPEITAIPLVAGLAAYLDWVDSTTRK